MCLLLSLHGFKAQVTFCSKSENVSQHCFLRRCKLQKLWHKLRSTKSTALGKIGMLESFRNPFALSVTFCTTEVLIEVFRNLTSMEPRREPRRNSSYALASSGFSSRFSHAQAQWDLDGDTDTVLITILRRRGSHRCSPKHNLDGTSMYGF